MISKTGPSDTIRRDIRVYTSSNTGYVVMECLRTPVGEPSAFITNFLTSEEVFQLVEELLDAEREVSDGVE